ncbi:MAG: hypothetical protein ABIH87_01765 [bacterium]
MFDDAKNTASPPNNLPVEPPEDIFAGVDNQANVPVQNPDLSESIQEKIPDALSAGLLTKKQPMANERSPLDLGNQAQSLNQMSDYKVREPILGKVLFIILILAIVFALVFGVWWVYSGLSEKTVVNDQITPETIVNKTEQTVVPVEDFSSATSTSQDVFEDENKLALPTSTSTVIGNQINNDNILFGETVDTDKDGLDDIREEQIKTNPNKADTDEDGLSDGDEVLVWKTDPLDSDTDDDTYLDGQEIKFGYNPLGPGKLFDLPQTITSQESTSTN